MLHRELYHPPRAIRGSQQPCKEQSGMLHATKVVPHRTPLTLFAPPRASPASPSGIQSAFSATHTPASTPPTASAPTLPDDQDHKPKINALHPSTYHPLYRLLFCFDLPLQPPQLLLRLLLRPKLLALVFLVQGFLALFASRMDPMVGDCLFEAAVLQSEVISGVFA